MAEQQAKLHAWQGVSFTSITINDHFWRPRLEVLRQTTLPDCLSKCEDTGRIDNFAKAGGLMEGITKANIIMTRMSTRCLKA